MATYIHSAWVEVPSDSGEAEVHRAPDAKGCWGANQRQPWSAADCYRS